MDSFPYDSWEEALEVAGGYFTFGPGGNAAHIFWTIVGIAIGVVWMIHTTWKEDKHLSEAAERIREEQGN